MNTAVLVLSLGNLALIGALPRVFFRRGALNLRWWVTALPFFASAATVFAGLVGFLSPLRPGNPATDLASVLVSGTSILLIGLTLGTHREPLSLWHQDEKERGALVTVGAYGRIRHPFYAAFLLALLSAALAFPHLSTVLCLVLGGLQLNRTAAGEERKLLESEIGRDYAAYRERTGRFIPKVRPHGRAVPEGGAASVDRQVDAGLIQGHHG